MGTSPVVVDSGFSKTNTQYTYEVNCLTFNDGKLALS